MSAAELPICPHYLRMNSIPYQQVALADETPAPESSSFTLAECNYRSHQHDRVDDNRANHTSNIYRSHCYRDIIRNDRFNIYSYSYSHRSIINNCKCTIWDYRHIISIYRDSINICRSVTIQSFNSANICGSSNHISNNATCN
ncbi:hypothetical protein AOLI_G00148380 [Acnodon oligacanthus]